ncbi:MAG: phosphatase [Hespellia sp.]|nr:phosphatase [Hespellia sp.]
MYGIIDIGSNTMRLSCYRVVEKELIPTFHKKNMAGLAGYVDDDNCLSKKGIKRAIDTLEDFKKLIMCVGLDKLYVIATASIRNVDNTEKVVKEIFDKTGIEVEILSGKQEAMYDFQGATYCCDSESGLVVDIGGGSTELVCFDDHRVEDANSIPVGSLNCFSKFVDGLFPTEEEEEDIRAFVRKHLDKLKIGKQKIILGVGGTNRACMKLYNDYYDCESDNTIMESDKITELLQTIVGDEKTGMKRILKIVPDRIHTIIPGMIVIDEINQYCKCKKIQLSAGGVREGYMVEKCCS